MGAKSLNRSSANHQVHLGNESMETLLRNTYCCMACSAKCIQSVGIRFLWEGSQPWKVTQKASSLKELVTNIPTVQKACDPTVHQGRSGQGWYQCNLKYQHAVPTATVDKITVLCVLPSFTDRVVTITQMRWFRRVFLVSWECRAALSLQH